MIKNFNDIVSIIVTITMVLYALRLFVWSLVDHEKLDNDKVNIFELFKDYNNNVEE